ncbi:MAG: putative zinc-binding protein [Rhodothermaceae bacterium]
MSKCCSCGDSKKNLIYSCSGAANTGYLADNVARKLMKENKGKMTCLSAIGAELSGFVESAKCVEKNLVIDGCPVACGKLIFEKQELPFEHFVLTEFDVEKGKTEITESVIDEITKKLSTKIG